MRYNGGIALHAANVRTRYREVFAGVCAEVERSVKDGSELTGAPGQPRRTSTLYFSWIGRFLAPFRWQLSTSIAYAQPIEEGMNDRATFDPSRGDPRSTVGGYHSISLTLLAVDRVLAAVTRRVRNAA